MVKERALQMGSECVCQSLSPTWLVHNLRSADRLGFYVAYIGRSRGFLLSGGVKAQEFGGGIVSSIKHRALMPVHHTQSR